MKFVAILKDLILYFTIILVIIKEFKALKIEKQENGHFNFSIPVTPKKTPYENIVLKNIDFVTLSENKKFSISKLNFKTNDIVSEIPLKNVIFVGNPLVKDFCRSLKIEEFSEDNILNYQLECITLFNLDQLKNTHENFRHYFDNDQFNFDNFLLNWKQEDLSILKNSLIENTLNDMKLTITDYLNLLKKSAYKKSFSFNELKKAFILMNSQNFKVEINQNVYNVMIPFLDIYSLFPNTNVDWSSVISTFNETLKLTALNDIFKGDPIITNYGNMDNANLLINFGFTHDNNTFPIESEFFLFKYQGNEYSITLREDSTKEIFENVRKIKVDILRQKQRKSKIFNLKYDKKEDLKIFETMLKELSKYSNKKRLENLLNNLYDSPHSMDIFRALHAEDKLIDQNMKYLAEIINILNGKTEIDQKLKNRQIYIENQRYFDSILEEKIEKKNHQAAFVIHLNNRI